MSREENYLVLARKYRPLTFADLKGQDALVQTLSNAINSNRMHHAYVLTGIRGTGKTTTARIIAKALNCENGPAVEWLEDDPQVQAIARGNHPDVLEFDAASHRGVEEISDLFEGVAYAPVMARTKVYIIDEVHMLSKHAFNALLKTLEEPPANVTFIFATTEVHKIPVTILSRCQRFDLRRIPAATLEALYQNILQQEKVKADSLALSAIARAADGSARDGLSLLDQAIALAAGKKITGDIVQDMLGLADRSKVTDVLEHMLQGQAATVLTQLDDLYALGQDPVLLLNELMQMTDTLTRLKVLPDMAKSKTLGELEQTRLVPLAREVPLENLARFYQLLLTAVAEARQADRPFEAMCMAAVRICHLASLPPLAQLAKQAPVATPQQAPAAEAAPVEKNAPWEEKVASTGVRVETWADVVTLIKEDKPALGAVLEQQGRCVDLAEKKLVFALDDGVHEGADVQRSVQQVLKRITGAVWEVQLAEASEGETLVETGKRQQKEKLDAAKEDPAVKEVMELFPGAEVVDVKEEKANT
jgi:DNA polymerase-3 subunit gamma/tau